MSAADGPTPDELAEQFPITAEEAQAIADAMTPLQNFMGVGDSLGNSLEDLPGPGPKLVGTVLQNISSQVNLASQNAEVLARAIDFYVTTQADGLEAAFPPPHEIAEQLRQQGETITEAIEQFGPPR